MKRITIIAALILAACGSSQTLRPPVTRPSTLPPATTSPPTTTAPPSKCQAVDVWEPDPACQPGALNPAVTQANFHQVICVGGTSQFRPPASYTTALKRRQIVEYGYADAKLSDYEEDHLIPLALGGNPTSEQNLWPEPWAGQYGAHVKDRLEFYLYKQACAGKIPLAMAQQDFQDWVASYQQINPPATPFGLKGLS